MSGDRLRRGGRWSQAALGSRSRLPALLVLLLVALQVTADPASAALTDPGTAPPSGPRPGALDRTFGRDGRVTTDFGPGMLSSAEALVVQPDGRLVAAGTVSPAQNFGLARYRADGRLDRRFGDGGTVVADTPDADFARALALLPDGKLVVAGYSFPPFADFPDFSLARFNPDGSLDTTFGTDGRVITDLRGMDYGDELVVQADGKLVVGGSTYYLSPAGEVVQDFALVRYLPDGSLDTTFGAGGIVVTDIGRDDSLGGLALQADGMLVAAGTVEGPNPGVGFARYRPDGTLDAGFGAGGIVVTDVAGVGAANEVIVQGDGKLVAAGSGLGASPEQSGFGLVRLRPDGSIDTGFGAGGGVTTGFPDFPSSLALTLVAHDDGRLTAAGTASSTTGSTSRFALASYRPDGSLDRGFGRDGRVLTRFAGPLTQATALVVQDDDKLVAAGATYDPDVTFVEFALARYHGRRPHPR